MIFLYKAYINYTKKHLCNLRYTVAQLSLRPVLYIQLKCISNALIYNIILCFCLCHNNCLKLLATFAFACSNSQIITLIHQIFE